MSEDNYEECEVCKSKETKYGGWINTIQCKSCGHLAGHDYCECEHCQKCDEHCEIDHAVWPVHVERDPD